MNNNTENVRTTEAQPPLALKTGSPFEREPSLINEAKLEINRLVWQYAPAEITLGQADDLACKILTSIQQGRYLV